MTAPPTDEQVAHAVADYDDVTVTNALAREVQAYRALRPDCPTCGGYGYVLEPRSEHPCRDCTDGKMPLDKWVALLVETLRSLRTDFVADGYPTVAYVPTIDAVLKMVPK